MDSKKDESYRPLVAGAFLFSVGPAAILLMPMIVGVYVDELGYTNRQAGILASVEAGGIGCASVLGLLWVGKLNWRTVTLLGLACSIIANLVATGVDDFATILLCRACASVGAGTAFAVSVACLGERNKPEKAYGIGLAVQTLLMMIIMASSAMVINWLGIDGLFIMLAVLAALVALPVGWLPRCSGKSAEIEVQKPMPGASRQTLVIVALIATTLHFIGAVGFWAYLERIANAAGHSTEVISTILACALGAGMLGAMFSAWLGDRWGFARPFVFSTIVLIATVLIAVGNVSVSMLALSAVAFGAMWVFATAYQAALVARLDRFGRLVVLVPAAQGTGAFIGPALAAMLVEGNYFLPVNILAVSCLGASLVLFLVATNGLRKIQSANDSDLLDVNTVGSTVSNGKNY